MRFRWRNLDTWPKLAVSDLRVTSGISDPRTFRATLQIRKTQINRKTMTTVSLSPKFQVVIPKQIREALKLVVGQRMEVTLHNGKVEFVPEKTILSYRGRWLGIDSTIERDPDRI